MKVIEYTKYGSPEVLRINEITKPTPKDNEVLIKIIASTVTIVDITFRKGNSFFARLFTGAFKPKNAIPGGDLVGEVEAAGKNVTRFKKGDNVFGPTSDGLGAHAMYVCLPDDAALVLKPEKMTCDEAATASYGFLTALPFLRDEANIKSGQAILIIGASGCIGTFAVQIAKYYGAHITGVCSSENVDMVKSLGADRVIDYKKTDFKRTDEKYDVVFDTAGKSSFTQCRRLLKDTGIYLTPTISPTILLNMLLTSKSKGKRAKIAFTGLRSAADKANDLVFFNELWESNKVKPVIGNHFTFDQIVEAHTYVERGHKSGSVVITWNSGAETVKRERSSVRKKSELVMETR
ncbi:NAD(P)-dependent alcohol dehydrogenase [candidate division KSB1 bacterium]|nr:NAD(P)-dependent alcohol dehydrogenase [candidate division KSB1 bacterium]